MRGGKRTLWRWSNLFSGVTVDNLKFPAGEDGEHDLLWWSDYELPRLLSMGAWFTPEEWEGTFAWVQRVHPREPFRAEWIPHAFETEIGIVFHSPQVRFALEQGGYTGEVQYLPVPLIEVCTEREIGRYYVANILACFRCVRKRRWKKKRLDIIVVYDLDELSRRSPLLRLQELEGGLSGDVVVWEEVMRLMIDLKLSEETDFSPIEWGLGS